MVSIDDEEESILEEFFDFEAFEKDQEQLLIEGVGDSSTTQYSEIKSEEWSVEDILQS